MTSILEHDLVRKYFGCGCFQDDRCHSTLYVAEAFMAYRILCGMEEPLKHGEKFILLSNDCGHELKVQEYVQDLAALGPIHPLFLRLPSRFQPSSESKECNHCFCEKASDIREVCCKCGRNRIKDKSNKFDAAVKRAFENDVIIDPGKVFEKPEECGCEKGLLGCPPSCECKCHPSNQLARKPCCAFHTDYPKSPSKCSEDIEPAASGKCAYGYKEHHEKCGPLCEFHAPDPAIEAKINTICDEIARCWVNREFVSASHQLRELITLARRSDR